VFGPGLFCRAVLRRQEFPPVLQNSLFGTFPLERASSVGSGVAPLARIWRSQGRISAGTQAEKDSALPTRHHLYAEKGDLD
jgi:hypothetical protein